MIAEFDNISRLGQTFFCQYFLNFDFLLDFSFSLLKAKSRLHENKSATSKMHLPHSAYWPCDLKFSQLLKTSLATKAVYSKFSIQISRIASLFSILFALKYNIISFRICFMYFLCWRSSMFISGNILLEWSVEI